MYTLQSHVDCTCTLDIHVHNYIKSQMSLEYTDQGCIIVSLSLGYIQGEHWQLKPGLQPTMDSIPGQQLLVSL